MTLDSVPLPRILCGPILRRVEPRSVSVFVALSEARFIDLTIHVDDPIDPTTGEIPLYTTYPLHSISKYAASDADIPSTVALGKHLHVAVVTLEIPDTVGALAPGILYGYNLRFYESAQSALDHTETDPSSSEIISLAQSDFNLLTGQDRYPDGYGHYPLGYAGNRLPSFSLPPKNFEHLNLVHGSCRKPHGEGNDMLAALDDLMVNASQYNDAHQRPHLLLLTGDQIYADDVSPPLLRALHDAAQALLGWDEVFYGTWAFGGECHTEIDALRSAAEGIINTDDSTTDADLEGLLDVLAEKIDALSTCDGSGQRELIQYALGQVRALGDDIDDVRQDGDAARDMAQKIKNHCDILGNLASSHHWGQTKTDERDYVESRISPPQREKELKEFAGLTSDEMVAHLMFLGEFYMMYLFTWSDELWPRQSKEIELPKFDEAVPNYGWLGALSKSSLEDMRADTEEFAKTLGKVRRVLANIPTLMIFDDHEVTDDWNLNEDWVRKVNGSVMGPSVLRNALAAYAVFQDWGNQPAGYRAGTKGREILNALTATIDEDKVTRPKVALSDPDDESKPSDVLFKVFGIGPVVPKAFKTGNELLDALEETGEAIEETIEGVLGYDPDKEVFYPAPAPLKQWDWVYDPYPGDPFFKVISLDTRTHRGYPTKRWALRYELPIKDLLQGDFGDVDGRVAPVALIHDSGLGRQLGPLPPDAAPPARLSDEKLNIVISPAPVFGLPLIEDFFQRYLVLSSGPEVADYEAWQGSPAGFDALVNRLRGKNVVLLSGDVHYAYSNEIEFAATADDNEPYRLLQLCSTSMKNETGMTRALGRAGRNGMSLEFFSPLNLARFGNAALELWGGLVDSYFDFRSFWTWFAETAPLVPVEAPPNAEGVERLKLGEYRYNPEAHITHYLSLKDNLLFSFNLLLPNAIFAMGDSMRGYIWDQLFPPDEAKKGYSVRFLEDRRGKHLRKEDATRFNPDGSEVNSYLEAFSEMREVVGYNNFGRLTFQRTEASPTKFKDVTHHLFWQVHDERSKPLPYLSSTRHKKLNRWNIFKTVFADEALHQLRRWQPPYKAAIKEDDEEGKDFLRGYYNYMEPEWTAKGISQPDDSELSGRAWSGLFISYCAKVAGAGDAFEYSPGHIFYMRAAARNRADEAADKPFWLYALDDEEDYEPEVGDIVCGWRDDKETDVVEQYSYHDVIADLDDANPPFRPSHCDIIVGKTATELHTVGGNTSLSGSGPGVTVGRNTVTLVDGKIPANNKRNIIAVIRVRTDLE